MYICIYVDSLLVALIFKVGFFRASFFRRGWIVLVLGRFGPPKDVEGFQRISKDFEAFRKGLPKHFEKGFRRFFEGFSKDFEGFRRISKNFKDFEGLGLQFSVQGRLWASNLGS